MTECAECGQDISTTAVMCPHCGAPPEVALAEPGSSRVPVDTRQLVEGAVRRSLHLPAEASVGAAERAMVESLKFDGTEVEDWPGLIAALKPFPKLKELGLSGTGLRQPEALATLGSIRYLFLEKNQVATAAGLCDMKQLKQLWLYGNPMPRDEMILLEQALPKCSIFI